MNGLIAKIEGQRITVTGSPIPQSLLRLLPKIEGRRAYTLGGYTFALTPYNVELLRTVVAIDLPTSNDQFVELSEGLQRPEWIEVIRSYSFQDEFFHKAWPLSSFALFAEMGLGKTKSAIDLAGRRWSKGFINGLLIIALNGVHKQWIDEQLPKHIPKNVPVIARAWEGKNKGFEADQSKFLIFSINFDAVKTKKGRDECLAFVRACGGKVQLVIDESQEVKNHKSARWLACSEICNQCNYALILSGTPIPNSLLDYWGQYNLLDERILGFKYVTTFKKKYCILGGHTGWDVVGSRNEEDLFKRTAANTFRITKREGLNLPEKLYDQVQFDMHPEQRELFKSMKAQFLADLGGGRFQTAANAAVALTRLHQITCGHLPLTDGTVAHLPNPRLTEALMSILERVRSQQRRKLVIWCRYNYDVSAIKALLGDRAVTYYGADSDAQRAIHKAQFIDPHSTVEFMISNPAAGGTGIDGYQEVAETAVYYSNSFNAVHRWQSEDRTHRIGMGAAAIYIDLICRGGIDNKHLSNLRRKKSMADLVLDDFRGIFDE